MNKRLLSYITGCVIGFVFLSGLALGAPGFYEGKTIRIIVGATAGGGFDTYARVFSRHMGRHIPGNPAMIVENMPGAGSLIAANYMYKAAKPDGLTIAHSNGGAFINQALGEPGIEFDARKFEFIGAAVKEEPTYAFTKASGITSIEKWMASERPVKMGGVAPGIFSPDNVVRIVRVALGLPIQLISGYNGTADIRLACESGELAGTAWGWNTMRATWRKALETGDVAVVLQGVPKPFPDLPNVPLAINLAKTDEARQLIEVGIHSPALFNRPFFAPPGIPKERLLILIRAFQETLKDKEFLAETGKAKLDIQPVSREELAKAVANIFMINPVMSAKLKEILLK